jgi:hypothetical protein
MTRPPRWHWGPILSAFLLGAALGVTSQRAMAQAALVNVERLVRDAGIIFSGRVEKIVSGEKEPEMNLYTTSYTFIVDEPLYGADSGSVTITQYGGEADGRSYYPAGVPRFELGEQVLVFFYPPSKIGLTSVVAKGQGKFVVGPADSLGTRLLENETHNKNLFRKMRSPDVITRPEWLREGAEGPIEYQPFVESVRHLIGIMKK